jgi:hypothetical protein
VQFPKPNGLDDRHSVGEGDFVLPRETHHDIGAQCEVAQDLLCSSSDFQEVFESSGPPHGLPERGVSGLKGDVKVPAGLWPGGQGFEKRNVDL